MREFNTEIWSEPCAGANQERPWGRWCRYVRSFKENRAVERKPAGVAAELCWPDALGRPIVVRAVCVDRSDFGLGLVCSTSIPPQMLVDVKLPADNVARKSYLRHCGRLHGGFFIGLQFLNTRNEPV